MSERFLFVIPTARIGGAERVMFNLVTYLLEQQKDVTLVTMSQGKQPNGWTQLEKYNNFHWIVGKYKSEKSSLIPITARLLSLNTKFKYDYIFSSHTHVNSYLSSLRKLGLFKESLLISRESFSVFETYTDYKSILFKQIYRYLYGSQDLLICQTESMKNSLVQKLGFEPVRKTKVIPNPVNLDYIKSNITSTAKEKIIIACGRLTEIKQFDLLIDAFYHFSKTHPEYKLVILGDGMLRDKLETQINLLDISNRVMLLGRTANPFQWFAKSEIGIIASKREGFPNVLLEMMASGTSKIIITPCTSGLKDIPGLIVTDNITTASMINGLNRATMINEDLSPIYQEYITKNHTVEIFINEILKFLNE